MHNTHTSHVFCLSFYSKMTKAFVRLGRKATGILKDSRVACGNEKLNLPAHNEGCLVFSFCNSGVGNA
jgi:hypothetical protein